MRQGCMPKQIGQRTCTASLGSERVVTLLAHFTHRMSSIFSETTWRSFQLTKPTVN
jgi:hypothetical protein